MKTSVGTPVLYSGIPYRIVSDQREDKPVTLLSKISAKPVQPPLQGLRMRTEDGIFLLTFLYCF